MMCHGLTLRTRVRSFLHHVLVHSTTSGTSSIRDAELTVLMFRVVVLKSCMIPAAVSLASYGWSPTTSKLPVILLTVRRLLSPMLLLSPITNAHASMGSFGMLKRELVKLTALKSPMQATKWMLPHVNVIPTSTGTQIPTNAMQILQPETAPTTPTARISLSVTWNVNARPTTCGALIRCVVS